MEWSCLTAPPALTTAKEGMSGILRRRQTAAFLCGKTRFTAKCGGESANRRCSFHAKPLWSRFVLEHRPPLHGTAPIHRMATSSKRPFPAFSDHEAAGTEWRSTDRVRDSEATGWSATRCGHRDRGVPTNTTAVLQRRRLCLLRNGPLIARCGRSGIGEGAAMRIWPSTAARSWFIVKLR